MAQGVIRRRETKYGGINERERSAKQENIIGVLNGYKKMLK